MVIRLIKKYHGSRIQRVKAKGKTHVSSSCPLIWAAVTFRAGLSVCEGKKKDIEGAGSGGREEALTASDKGREHLLPPGILTSYPHLNRKYHPQAPHPNAISLWGRFSTTIWRRHKYSSYNNSSLGSWVTGSMNSCFALDWFRLGPLLACSWALVHRVISLGDQHAWAPPMKCFHLFQH